MRLYPTLKREIDLADFIESRNAPMEILKLFHEWLILSDYDEAAEEIAGIIRSNGGTV